VPTEPTRELVEAGAQEEILWTELTEVFPPRAASPPVGLEGLRPGLSGAEARASLEAAHQPGVPVIGRTAGGHMVLTTLLADFENVGLTVILDDEGAALEHLEVSLPDAAALPMLSVRWGEPTAMQMSADGQPVYLWAPADTAWKVELRTVTAAGAIREQHPVVREDSTRAKAVLVYSAP
jgi:hypothetical protein